MVNKEGTLITIIVLLLIFLPLTIVGYIYKDKEVIQENPNHEFKYNNMLWFYNDNNEVISKYKCITNECGYATTLIDDNEYNIEYQSIDNINTNKISNDYAFIKDGEDIFFYNINTGSSLIKLNGIKNYGYELSNDSYIIKDDNNKWGILSFSNGLNRIIDNKYDFISLKNNKIDNNVLDIKKMIVKDNNNWYLIDIDDKVLTSEFNEVIYDYDDNFIYTKNGIFKYNGKEIVNGIINKEVIDNYIVIKTNEYLYIFDDLNNEPIKKFYLNSNYNYKVIKEDEKINIYRNEIIIDSID